MAWTFRYFLLAQKREITFLEPSLTFQESKPPSFYVLLQPNMQRVFLVNILINNLLVVDMQKKWAPKYGAYCRKFYCVC